MWLEFKMLGFELDLTVAVANEGTTGRQAHKKAGIGWTTHSDGDAPAVVYYTQLKEEVDLLTSRANLRRVPVLYCRPQRGTSCDCYPLRILSIFVV